MADYSLDDEIPQDNSLLFTKVFPLLKEYAQGNQTDNQDKTVFGTALAEVFLRCRPRLEALYRSFGN